MDDREIVTVDFGDDRKILVEARTDGDPEADVGVGDLLKFDRVVETIDAVSESVLEAIKRAAPKKASVEFGVDVGVESGGLTSMLVKGTGTATLKITLEWGAV
jgi:hypothetical protein